MELETLRKDANLVAGCGTVQLRPVYCFAQDFTSASGAMTASQSRKIAKVLDITDECNLLVKFLDGEKEEAVLSSGEVSIRPK